MTFDVDQPSHYEMIGRAEAFWMVADRAFDIIGQIPHLASYFQGRNIHPIKEGIVNLLCSAAGGPQKYDGRDLAEIHWRLGITVPHFREVCTIFQGCLWHVGYIRAMPAPALGMMLTDLGRVLVGVQKQIVAPQDAVPAQP